LKEQEGTERKKGKGKKENQKMKSKKGKKTGTKVKKNFFFLKKKSIL